MLQVKYMMGLSIPRFDKLQDTMRSLANNLTLFSWREYVVRSPSSPRDISRAPLHRR